MYLSDWVCTQDQRLQRPRLAVGAITHLVPRLVGASSLSFRSVCPSSSPHTPRTTWLLCSRRIAGFATSKQFAALLTPRSPALSPSLSYAAHFSGAHVSPEPFCPDSHRSLHVLLNPALLGGAFQCHFLAFHVDCLFLKGRCSQRDTLLCLLLINWVQHLWQMWRKTPPFFFLIVNMWQTGCCSLTAFLYMCNFIWSQQKPMRSAFC